MDKEKTVKKQSFLERIFSSVRDEAARRKSERGALLCDAAVFLCAFLFSKRHIAFGTYPLGSALVAVLPSRVWLALIGTVVGSLSMGKSGVIGAIISIIILILRIIISSSFRDKGESTLFCEPIIMRLSAATIGAFVGAGYEMLLSGFSLSSVLFGVFGVGLTLGFAFVFSGLFFADIKIADFLYGERAILRKREGDERLGIILFRISFSVLVLLLSLSLEAYTYFGISPAYVFSVAVALYISRRFGWINGMAIGFISSVAVSPLYSPAFALVGAVSGALYGFGIGYALCGAGILFCAWGGYVGGINGFLSLLPEYLISAALVFSALRRARTEREEGVSESISKQAEDMVGAARLSERGTEESVSALSEALLLASDRIREFWGSDGKSDFEEYRRIINEALKKHKILLEQEIINKISTKLYKKQKLSSAELGELSEKGVKNEVFDEIASECSEYERSLYERRRAVAMAEEYALISRMLDECRSGERRARAENKELGEKAREVFIRYGFPEGNIKVLGDETVRVIGAGLDADGSLITSAELHRALEGALGVRLSDFEYFRKGDMALFKACSAPSFSVEYATVSEAAALGEVSGDSAQFFGTALSFFSLISDGMGSGIGARECADFVTGYLSELLMSGVGVDNAASALSHVMRNRGGECTATLDLFRLDLASGEGTFVKSGAAPSYVKRDKSIFRIRSETAPIGLLKAVDAEKIRVEVKGGDYVVMLSDGISTSVEDSAWLLSYLTREPPESLEDYCREIIALARKNTGARDDMTVSVVKIIKKS